MESIQEIVRRAESNYRSGGVQLGDHVNFDMRATIEKIYAYLNSQFVGGDKDSLGRDKPFFNIVTAAVNIWYRATDIDRKDIILRENKSADIVTAFLATVQLKDWMRRQRFGVFLNQWGRTLAQYGSAVSKFVIKDGELTAKVIPWNRMLVDPVDFSALSKIERIYLTPAQLRAHKEYDQDVVENLLSARVTRKTSQGQNIDTTDEFIEIYEVHGEMPRAYLKDKPTEDDETDYVQQMHVVSFIATNGGRYDDFTLYRGIEKKDPYMITHLIEEDGRTLSIGAVEYLFDAQWMQNHTMKNMKDTLDLASRILFQTADVKFQNRNVLSAIETGDILVHGVNAPLTQVNTTKVDITSLQNFSSQWKVLAQELTSTPESMRGTQPPSQTPYALQQLLTNQAGSLFEVMKQNKALSLEDILREHVIPHLKTKLDTTDEVAAVLEDHDIKRIDAMYVPKAAIVNYNNRMAEQVLEGQSAEPFDQMMEEQNVRKEMAPLGNKRMFKPTIIKDGKEVDISWKKAFEDFEWDVEIGITNEPMDKQSALTTLSTLIQATDPMKLQDPSIRTLFTKILSLTGVVSPLEISVVETQPMMQGMPASQGSNVPLTI